ncbi:MAG: hypothetical protein WCI11_18045 [Candidatus Methylumidiphilus sp.]
MNSLLITVAVFLCSFCGILLGSYIREKLPDHHLKDDSKDIVILSTGLIATLTALILGLLVASANDAYRSFSGGLEEISSDILTMDRAMAYYGSETQPIREKLRQHVLYILMTNWPEDEDKLAGWVAPSELAAEPVRPAGMEPFSNDLSTALKKANALSDIQDMLLKLTPKDDAQRWRQTRALEMSGNMAEKRWLLVAQSQSSLPTPFLVVLVIWLVILFVIFSLFAPRNKTVTTVLLLCALSVSGSIFLILELNKPTSGLLKASSAPFLKVIEIVGK